MLYTMFYILNVKCNVICVKYSLVNERINMIFLELILHVCAILLPQDTNYLFNNKDFDIIFFIKYIKNYGG